MNERLFLKGKGLCLALAILILSCSSVLAAKPEERDENSTVTDLPDFPRNYGRSTLWSMDHYGQFYFSGGYSYFFPKETVLGYKFAIDYQITKRWGIGVHAANYHHFIPLKQARTPILGGRGMFTVISPGKRPGRTNVHLYLGVGADMYFGEYGQSGGEITVKADPFVGFRYRIYDHWFFWSELSTRTGTFGVSFEY